MTAPTAELVAELARGCRRPHHPRRRRQDRPDPGAARQARLPGQARRRRCALQRGGPARKPDRARHRVHRSRSARSRPGRRPAEDCRMSSSWPGASSASSGQEDLTWAMNAHVPALVAEAFAGSRIVAYSTGCVYPYVNVRHGGATEADADDAAARRLCQLLRRARADVPVFLAHARHAGPHHPAQLRDRHALRRAARRGVAGEGRRDDRPRDRPRQRDLAGRCQRHGAARARSLHHAVDADQCQRTRDDQHPLARRSVRRAFRQDVRSSPAKRRRPLARQHRRGDAAVRLSAGAARPADRLDRRLDRARPAEPRQADRLSASAMAPSDLPEIGRLDARRAGGCRRRWSPRPAGTRLPRTGGMFLDFGTVYAVRADDARDRNRRHAALWRAIRLDQHGAGRRWHIAGAGSRRACSIAASPTSSARGLVPVLDATPAGRTVYAPLGFQDGLGLRAADARSSAIHPGEPSARSRFDPITDTVWPALLCLRCGRVRRRPQRSPRRVCADACRQPICSRSARAASPDCCSAATAAPPSHLGPLIAEDDATAQALLTHGLGRIGGPVYIDLADAKADIRAGSKRPALRRSVRSPACCSARRESFDDVAPHLRGGRTGIRLASINTASAD